MRYDIIGAIERPNGNREFITGMQTAKDIVRQMKRAEYNSRRDSKKLAKFFGTDDELKTCKRLWAFLRNEIYYNAEPLHDQNAKTISRFIRDGYGDCKHFAITSVGVLNACGIPAFFTLAGQEYGVKKPNHAYCTALVGNKEIVIDPCRKNFNTECKHFYKWTVSPIKK
jgi:hypothetical protein